MNETKSDDHSENLAKILGNVLTLSVNETLVLAQLEAFSFFSPMPPPIPMTKGSPLEQKLGDLSEALGGPPKIVFVKDGAEPPQFDTYVDAAIGEVVDTFMRARMSVCRTHL